MPVIAPTRTKENIRPEDELDPVGDEIRDFRSEDATAVGQVGYSLQLGFNCIVEPAIGKAAG